MALAAGSMVLSGLASLDLGFGRSLRSLRLSELAVAPEQIAARTPRSISRSVSASAHSCHTTAWVSTQSARSPSSPSASAGTAVLDEPFPYLTSDVAMHRAAADHALALAKEAAKVAREAAAMAEASDLSLLQHLTDQDDSWSVSSFLRAGGLVTEDESSVRWCSLLAKAPAAGELMQGYISDKQQFTNTFAVATTTRTEKAVAARATRPKKEFKAIPAAKEVQKRVVISSGKKGKRGPSERRSTKAVVADGTPGPMVQKMLVMGVPGSMRDLMDSTPGTSGLLSGEEEIQLATSVQELLKLEAQEEVLSQRLGRKPTREELAKKVKLSVAELDRTLVKGKSSKQRMMSCNMGLVIAIGRKYSSWGLSLEEILTRGCCGLIKAIEKFDHRRGFKFSTYAHWWIRQAIGRSVTEQSRTVRMPPHIYEILSRINKAKDMLVRELGRTPADDEVAELVGMSTARLRKVIKSARPMVSMDKPTTMDAETTLGAFVASPEDDSHEVAIERKLLNRDLENALHTLLPREREVLRQRFGLQDGRPRTLEEVGAAFRVTRERIRQLEHRALRKLRQANRSSVLQEYVE